MPEKPTYEELEKRIQELEQSNPDHKSVKKALVENQDRFKLFYERVPLAYQSLDEKGNFISVNSSWLDALGYSSKEVIGKSFSNFLQPGWKDHFKKYFPRFKAIGEILGVEFEMIKKDGSAILVSFHGKISKDKNGTFQQTHCIFQDITKQKQAENNLQESEDRYRNFFKNNHSPMLVIDHETADILDANPAAISFYGWSHQEITEKKISEINMLSKDEVSKEMERAVKEKRKNFYFRHRMSNNEIKDVEVYSGPIKLNGKNLLYSIVHDITIRKKIEDEKRKSNQTLKKKVKKRTAELEDMNAALRVLLKKRESDKKEMSEKILVSYQSIVSPFLQKLKNTLTKKNQQNLMHIIESNLVELIEPFSKKISDPMVKLTPIEIQIAAMIKQGLSSKEISQTLNNSVRTITNHRQHIRNKFGLENKKINLRSYLSTL